MREIRSPLDGILSPFATARDAYSAAGISPLLVADFTKPYFRKAGSTSTFADTFTHSRAGNATMVDSDGLIKWAPHNLISGGDWSTGWTAFGLTQGAQVDGPLGTGTARIYTFPQTTAIKSVYRSTFPAPGYNYKIGVVVSDANEVTHVCLSDNNITVGVWFNISTGQVALQVGAPLGANITPLGGGAYYLEVELPNTGQFAIFFSDRAQAAWAVAPTDGYITLEAPRAYRSDLGGMVNNPDTGNSYVPTTSAAIYQARRNHHTYNGTSWVNSGLLLETEARTNLLYGTNTLATQTYTTTAVPHTLSFTGTGTVTLSGSSTAGPLVGTGTGENNRVNLTFTPTAAGLTLTVTGTVTNAQLEIGSTPSSYMPNPGGVGTTATRPAESLQIAAADMPWDASNVSLQMQGKITYADGNSNTEAYFLYWFEDFDNFITQQLSTDAGGTGSLRSAQRANSITSVVGGANNYSPDILVPYNIASRHGSNFINGAIDGTALTEDTTPTALPDLSATDFSLGYDYMGTIGLFRAWNVDIGDTGIEDATS